MFARDTAHFLTSPKIPDAKGIFVMIQFTPVGDSGVLAVCGSEISEQVNAQVMALDAAVQAAQLPGVVETVPTYAALLVTLDPLQTDADTLIPVLRRLWDALLPVNSTAAGRLVEVPVCYGGDYGPDLAFVAQHAGLTEQQVIDILTGKITNWKEVGGDDQPITLIHRAKSAGSRATISDVVLKGAAFTDNAVIQDSNGAVRAAIASTPGSIGYVDAPYADDSVKILKFDGVEYSPENIIAGKYPIYGYGHMYTKGEPTGAVKAFIDYILSDEFQNTQVEKLGFIPVNKMKK